MLAFVLAFLWLLEITSGISWSFPIEEIEQWFVISGKEYEIDNFYLKFIIANPGLGQGVFAQD